MLLSIISQITWDPNPEIFSLGPFTLRYYGLSYAIAFIFGYYQIVWMFTRDHVPIHWLYKGFLYVLLGVVIGGRLGHVFFYEWSYYSQHPEEILMFWKGGMASHGAGAGVIVAVIVYSKTISKRSILWSLDYASIVVASGAFFIRLGNLMNSEIVGKVTDVPWAFRFVNASGISQPWLPRHPAQLYEAIIYLLTYLILMYMYWCTNARKRHGLILGVLLIGLFGTRIFIEFFKENQEAFEDGMILNMGQLLSIPFALMGVFFIIRALKRKPEEIVISEEEFKE